MVASPRVVNIADLRRLAKRRLPRAVFDYIDGGADGELTLGENCRVFDTVKWRPRSAVATPNCELGTTVLGVPIALPLLLAPVGSRSVRALIERVQPVLSLHGHIHESRAATRIGRTLAVNPGSVYGEGTLQGALITLEEGRVVGHQLVSG